MHLYIRSEQVHVVRQLPTGLLRTFREGKHVINSFSYTQCICPDLRKREILGLETMKSFDQLNGGSNQEIMHSLK